MTLFYFFLEEKMCPGFGVPLTGTRRQIDVIDITFLHKFI